MKKAHRLSKTMIDVMHLINSFAKRHNIKDEAKNYMVDDTLQMTEKDTCGIIQLYFYIHLFYPLENSAIVESEKSTKKRLKHY